MARFLLSALCASVPLVQALAPGLELAYSLEKATQVTKLWNLGSF